jgi:hypothetical protein
MEPAMRTFFLILSATFFACAHSTPEGAPPPAEGSGPPPGGEMRGPPPDDGSPVVTPAEVPWDKMDEQQHRRYMSKVVVPKAREVFQAFDAKDFAKVGCATCHGKKGKENKFKMPSPELPVLPSSEKEFMETTMKEKPEMVKFMHDKVTPMMAELLGEKPFDPAAPDPAAFGCHGCHTFK